MSEVQAKVEDDATVVSEVAVVEVVEGQSEELALEPTAIEIAVEDSDQPSHKKVSRIEKRLRGKNNQISEAQQLATDTQAQLDASNEELKLYKMRDQQQSEKVPSIEDFDTDDQYEVAKRTYDDNRYAEISRKQQQESNSNSERQAIKVSQSRQHEESMGSHYERADKLNVTNYDVLEGNAVSALGEDFINTIIANTDNSELLIASIGASPAKAAALATLAQTQPARAFAQAVAFQINSNLVAATLKPAPSPETKVASGSSGQLGGWELKLSEARAKTAESGNFSFVSEVKKAAREAGVTL